MTRKSPRNGTSGKRESILRAATRVFARNGYFNSKVADIAREAEVADGTVYLYFKSKEEILHSIFDQNMAEASAAGRVLIEKIRDPGEKLRRIAMLHLERLGAETFEMKHGNAAQLLARIAYLLNQYATGGNSLGHILIEDGVQNLFFAFEIEIDSAVGYLGFARDVSYF